ncbi:unnamed protein product [Gemmata massiliana]|uniref:DUF4105 domain-containing protein n=1 Tax=Gemmata massiliana TaxID=1210884 RepID=A0A6P2CWF1_9BACT|nr:hypothetical protein [Gemmata massiliana]VTR93269.1 unnamed protein product [Gemmata massiliana]
MSNKYQVTVFIWFEGDLKNNETGHSALKLQQIGAEKGDYYYLSVWPSTDDRKFIMPGRYGKTSLKAASESTKPKILPTSVRANEKDHFKDGHKAEKKYRFTGPSYNEMAIFMFTFLQGKITVTDSPKAKPGKYHFLAQNCSTAVAYCLKAGGAPAMPNHLIWGPSYLAGWCDELVEHYGGEIVENGSVTLFKRKAAL